MSDTQRTSEEKITTPVIDVELTAAQQLRAGGLCVEIRKQTVSDCFTACCLVIHYQDKIAELERHNATLSRSNARLRAKLGQWGKR
jgi:hypothetical protein